jgi:hypothetical protein
LKDKGNKTNESKLQSKELYGNKADYLLARLEQELGKVDIDKPYNIRISNNSTEITSIMFPME